jgi:hypothetical protein
LFKHVDLSRSFMYFNEMLFYSITSETCHMTAQSMGGPNRVPPIRAEHAVCVKSWSVDRNFTASDRICPEDSKSTAWKAFTTSRGAYECILRGLSSCSNDMNILPITPRHLARRDDIFSKLQRETTKGNNNSLACPTYKQKSQTKVVID